MAISVQPWLLNSLLVVYYQAVLDGVPPTGLQLLRSEGVLLMLC